MVAELGLSTDYAVLRGDLKTRIRSAQTRAALSVNRELMHLYWQIGQSLDDWAGQLPRVEQLEQELERLGGGGDVKN